MPKEQPGVSKAQAAKAVEALLKFVGKKQEESTALFGDDEELLYLVGWTFVEYI